MNWKILCIFLLKFLSSDAMGSNEKLERFRRGASVYRTYIPSTSGHNPYLLNNNDPSGFIQYLGGGQGGSKGSSGSYGQTLLNSYNQHAASQPKYSPPASSGWQPRPTESSNDHRHSASVLQHAAQSSFNAQTAVFNALTEGSNPTSYKGGCPGCD